MPFMLRNQRGHAGQSSMESRGDSAVVIQNVLLEHQARIPARRIDQSRHMELGQDSPTDATPGGECGP